MAISGGKSALRRGAAPTLVGVALVVLFAALRAWDPAPLQVLRLNVFDVYQQIQPRVAEQQPVVIVDIDEASLAAYGQWPWPRTRMAELVDRITRAGPVAIGMDVIFAESDRLSPAMIAAETPGLDDQTRRALASLPSNDSVFADAISGSLVVLGQSGVRADVGAAQAGEAGDGPRTNFAILGDDPRPHLLQFPRLLRNVPVIEAAAAGRGLVSLGAEPDGLVRRVPAIMLAGDQLVPSLGVELLRVASGETTVVVQSAPEGVQGFAIGLASVPTDASGRIWVHFAPRDPARYISARAILEGQANPELLAGKLVLVGTSAVGLLDLRATPLDPALPGVEVHAQVLETIISGENLSRPAFATGLELALSVVGGLLFALLAPRLRARWLLALGAAVAGGLIVLSWRAYTDQRVLIDVVYPLMTTFTVFIAVSLINYLRDEKEKDSIRGAFGRYLAPQVVERLASNPDQLVLGGEERELTILFSDARNFTAISEGYKNDPQGLTELMNGLLTPLSNAIIERDGTIDKYIGDAIMAFWNAPLDVEDHALGACETALEMRSRLFALNAARRKAAAAAGRPFLPLDIGIGINTGECVVGNMGSDLRFDYSALGDAVNLASRLESLTRSYSAPILVGSRTAAGCGRRLALLEIDLIRVKGKMTPEAIHLLLGGKEAASRAAYSGLRTDMGAALSAYRQQDWDAAERGFAAVRDAVEAASRGGASEGEASDPDAEAAARAMALDVWQLPPVLDIYAARIARLRAEPPGSDWEGVEVATSK